MGRGRPRHPDVLTPREWEVLALLRDGLSNHQIAGRLGISVNGVKYHVAEILSKLGVESRYEAAAWHPAPARGRFAAFGLVLVSFLEDCRKVALPRASAVMVAAAAVFLVLLAAGQVIMSQRSPGVPGASFGPRATPDVEALAPSPTPTSIPESPIPSAVRTPFMAATKEPGLEEPRQAIAPGGSTAQGVPDGSAVRSSSDDGLQSPIPAEVEQALGALAAEMGRRFVGLCPTGSGTGDLLCYDHGGFSVQGDRLRFELKALGEGIVYNVVLEPAADGGYLVSATEPTPLTIPLPQ